LGWIQNDDPAAKKKEGEGILPGERGRKGKKLSTRFPPGKKKGKKGGHGKMNSRHRGKKEGEKKNERSSKPWEESFSRARGKEEGKRRAKTRAERPEEKERRGWGYLVLRRGKGGESKTSAPTSPRREKKKKEETMARPRPAPKKPERPHRDQKKRKKRIRTPYSAERRGKKRGGEEWDGGNSTEEKGGEGGNFVAFPRQGPEKRKKGSKRNPGGLLVSWEGKEKNRKRIHLLEGTSDTFVEKTRLFFYEKKKRTRKAKTSPPPRGKRKKKAFVPEGIGKRCGMRHVGPQREKQDPSPRGRAPWNQRKTRRPVRGRKVIGCPPTKEKGQGPR